MERIEGKERERGTRKDTKEREREEKVRQERKRPAATVLS